MFYMADKSEDLSPDAASQINSERLLQRDKQESQDVQECLQQRPESWNIKRLLLMKENQPSQIIQLFSVFEKIQESESVSHSVVADSLQLHGLQSARLVCPWNFPDKNIGVSCHFLLQGIFPTQGLNPHLLSSLHWQGDCLPPYHPGFFREME